MRFALYVGEEAIATTAPVFASSTTTAPQRPPSWSQREPLDVGTQGEDHVVPVHRLAAEPVELLLERVGEVRVRAGQVVVERLLEPGRRPGVRRVADHLRCEVVLGVVPRVDRQAVLVGLAVLREDGAVGGEDLAAVDREPRDVRDGVFLAGREVGLRPRLPVGRRDDEDGEQDEREDGEVPELLVHAGGQLPVRSVGDEHQPGDEQEVGHHARSSVRDEGQRDARQRDDPRDTADDDERLESEAEAEPGGEQLREPVAGGERDLEAAYDEGHVEQQQRGDADQPELLREGRVDEVGVQVGDHLACRSGR